MILYLIKSLKYLPNICFDMNKLSCYRLHCPGNSWGTPISTVFLVPLYVVGLLLIAFALILKTFWVYVYRTNIFLKILVFHPKSLFISRASAFIVFLSLSQIMRFSTCCPERGSRSASLSYFIFSLISLVSSDILSFLFVSRGIL